MEGQEEEARKEREEQKHKVPQWRKSGMGCQQGRRVVFHLCIYFWF